MKKFICLHCGANEYSSHDNGEPCQRCMGKMIEETTDIERAIESLEYFISGDCCGNQMDFVEEIEMGITALREKQERDKGCEYCTDYEDLASMKRVGCIYIDGNLLVADLYSESMAAEVRYCPMCGKELEVEP
jgi:hypothetical protein